MTQHNLPTLYPIQYRDLIDRALIEDLGRGGDLTSSATVPPDLVGTARLVTREPGIVAGTQVAMAVFRALDQEVVRVSSAQDGASVGVADELLVVTGSVRSILAAERTALNFLGRLGGIATLTGRFVAAVAGHGAVIVCTRKTTPGLRTLEKYAVRCGDGANHRFGLDDAVLIKDNHLLAAGGVRNAVERARAMVGHTVTVELEVDTLEQLEEALALGVDAVLLDNMSLEELRRAVEMVAGRIVTEASGGVTLDNVAEIAATGVDLISVGALTHSVRSLDVSLELELAPA
jgi:nicotinate-nucleotide pyrophosphorylase (carboxylating)